MKTKSLILIAFAAIITLSFSFAASNRSEKISAQKTTVALKNINIAMNQLEALSLKINSDSKVEANSLTIYS